MRSFVCGFTALNVDRRIVAVCRSGGRSAAITDALRAWGYDAVNLAGGMCAWAAAGLPVEVAPQAGNEAVDVGMLVHRLEPLNCETPIPAPSRDKRAVTAVHLPTPASGGRTRPRRWLQRGCR